jgi:hypothetical protein
MTKKKKEEPVVEITEPEVPAAPIAAVTEVQENKEAPQETPAPLPTLAKVVLKGVVSGEHTVNVGSKLSDVSISESWETLGLRGPKGYLLSKDYQVVGDIEISTVFKARAG